MQIKFNLVVLGVWVSKRLTYVCYLCAFEMAFCMFKHLYWPMRCMLCMRWITPNEAYSTESVCGNVCKQWQVNNVACTHFHFITFSQSIIRYIGLLDVAVRVFFYLFKWTNSSSHMFSSIGQKVMAIGIKTFTLHFDLTTQTDTESDWKRVRKTTLSFLL